MESEEADKEISFARYCLNIEIDFGNFRLIEFDTEAIILPFKSKKKKLKNVVLQMKRIFFLKKKKPYDHN